MLNTNTLRGLALMAIALFFAFNAFKYPVGDLARAGPGLFPLIVSGMLFVLAGFLVVQARFERPIPINFNIKNIALVLLSLLLFVFASKIVSMFLGIALLVFVAGAAGSSYSLKRNTQVTIALIIVAVAFERLLGLNLGLL